MKSGAKWSFVCWHTFPLGRFTFWQVLTQVLNDDASRAR